MSGIQYTGRPLAGEQSGFLADLERALLAHGVTHVNVISAYRSPAYNASVGGASRSNHTTGQAMDATAFIPGRGWVPIGVLLASDASRYGLRSGDTPGFFHGMTDPNHVDDAANVGGPVGTRGVTGARTVVAAPRGVQGLQVPAQGVPSGQPDLSPIVAALLSRHTTQAPFTPSAPVFPSIAPVAAQAAPMPVAPPPPVTAFRAPDLAFPQSNASIFRPLEV